MCSSRFIILVVENMFNKKLILGLILVMTLVLVTPYAFTTEAKANSSEDTRKVFPKMQNNVAKRSLTQVLEGETVIFQAKGLEDHHFIEEFEFRAGDYLGAVYMSLEHLGSEKPEEIPSVGIVHSYCNISAENAEDDKIDQGEITFRVKKSWVEQREIQSNQINLYRYQDGWKELETNQIGETQDYYRYMAETSGFSYFAAAVESKVRTTSTVDQEIYEKHLEQASKNWIRLSLGKIASISVNASFTEDTMNYKNSTYESEWRKEDYGLIEFSEDKTYIVGTHRYGTEAATMYYKEQNPSNNTLIHWEDQNDDEEVQYEEIEVIN